MPILIQIMVVEELCYNWITNTVKVCRVTLFELTLKQLIPNCSDEKKKLG